MSQPPVRSLINRPARSYMTYVKVPISWFLPRLLSYYVRTEPGGRACAVTCPRLNFGYSYIFKGPIEISEMSWLYVTRCGPLYPPVIGMLYRNVIQSRLTSFRKASR